MGTWAELPNNILPDIFLHVKDMCDMQMRKRDRDRGDRSDRGGRSGAKGGKNSGKERQQSDRALGEKPPVCTSYNDFFTGTGCAYEYNTQRKCSFEHFCSKCHASSGSKVVHKARFCTVASSAPSTVPTTSG